MTKRRTFQEFPTKAYDMETMITNHCGNSFSSTESNKDKVEFKKNVKSSKKMTKEAMSVSISDLVRITGKSKSKYK